MGFTDRKGVNMSTQASRCIAEYVASCDSPDTDSLQFWNKVIQKVDLQKNIVRNASELRNFYNKELYKLTLYIKSRLQNVDLDTELTIPKSRDLSAIVTKLSNFELWEIKVAYETFNTEAQRKTTMEGLVIKFRSRGVHVSQLELKRIYEDNIGKLNSTKLEVQFQKLPMKFTGRQTTAEHKFDEKMLPINIFNGEKFVIVLPETSWLTLTERRNLEYLVLGRIYGGKIEYNDDHCDKSTVVPLCVESNEEVLENVKHKYKKLYNGNLVTTSIENGVYHRDDIANFEIANFEIAERMVVS